MRHLASAHSNESYECALCEKSFQQKDRSRRHRLSVHDKTTEATCLKSGKTFARIDNLRRQQKICCRCKQCLKQFESVSSSCFEHCLNPANLR